MIAFPPHRTKVSIAVSPATALAHLTAYLNSSESKPHLLPNAHLDPSIGPTTGSSKYPVTFHNLRRVQSGLRGEWLAPSLELNDDIDVQSVQKAGIPADDLFETTNFKSVVDTIKENETQILEQIQVSDHEVDPQAEILVSEQPVMRPDTETKIRYVDKEARKIEKKARRKAQKKSSQKTAAKS